MLRIESAGASSGRTVGNTITRIGTTESDNATKGKGESRAGSPEEARRGNAGSRGVLLGEEEA